jgi:hypothetical protein
MNWRLQAIQIYLPKFIKRKKLIELFDLTAQAFQRNAPDLNKLSFEKCLDQYAIFTKTAAAVALQKPEELPAIKNKLYQKAFQMGQKIRAELHVRTFEDVMLASKILYRVLAIDFQGNINGEVTITRCFFSQYYSSEVCEIIAALDEGVAAGLSNGGILTFSNRITEGHKCCKAQIYFKELS